MTRPLRALAAAVAAALVALSLTACSSSSSGSRESAGSAAGPAGPGVAAPGAVVDNPRLAALPKWVGLGLAAQPDNTGLYQWVPEAGVPWDFFYQYLSSGANTTFGWRFWKPDATFPLEYAKKAAELHALPVFSYYQLLQSNGPCGGCGEAKRLLAHLNSPDTMRDYYADYTTLLRRLGPGTADGIAGFGGPAIVHVEPDLAGYAQQATLAPGKSCFGFCSGRGNDPSLLRASVASSGVADVAAFPDTYAGFSRALAALRDTYAPNVILAFHVNVWSTRTDIGASHSASLDPAALGTDAGAFAARAGAEPGVYDLVFNDVSDRDAGLYKYERKDDRFWDASNATFPNFHRWERYIVAAQAATRLPTVVWQVPLGNQAVRTMDNTPGHYQDNRVAYFLDHMAELKAAGVAAVLFGSGGERATTYYDANGDGITNPEPVCTTDGSPGVSVCPTQDATVSDDDGGYLRARAAAYYAAPLAR